MFPLLKCVSCAKAPTRWGLGKVILRQTYPCKILLKFSKDADSNPGPPGHRWRDSTTAPGLPFCLFPFLKKQNNCFPISRPGRSYHIGSYTYNQQSQRQVAVASATWSVFPKCRTLMQHPDELLCKNYTSKIKKNVSMNVN